MSRRPGHGRVLLGALLLLAGAAAVDAWHLAQARAWNRAIADGSVVDADGELPAAARFARAWYLERQGARERAIAAYKDAERGAGDRLAAAARYNRANAYLRWAMELRGERAQALPLIELAKQTYRDLLRERPGDWDARYNLERALRLLPDPEAETRAEGPQPLERERAVTTMRGFTLGLP